MSLDGRTLVLVVQPSILLAGAVTVMGKLALPAAVELLLPLEARVAHNIHKAGNGGRKPVIGGHHTGFWGAGVRVLAVLVFLSFRFSLFKMRGLGFQRSPLAVAMLLADIFQ